MPIQSLYSTKITLNTSVQSEEFFRKCDVQEYALGIDIDFDRIQVTFGYNGKYYMLPFNNKYFYPTAVFVMVDGQIITGDSAVILLDYNSKLGVPSIISLLKDEGSLLIEDQEYTAEMLLCVFIRGLKKRIAECLGFEPLQAVVSLPAEHGIDLTRKIVKQFQDEGICVKRWVKRHTAINIHACQLKGGEQRIETLIFNGSLLSVGTCEVESGVAEELGLGFIDTGDESSMEASHSYYRVLREAEVNCDNSLGAKAMLIVQGESDNKEKFVSKLLHEFNERYALFDTNDEVHASLGAAILHNKLKRKDNSCILPLEGQSINIVANVGGNRKPIVSISDAVPSVKCTDFEVYSEGNQISVDIFQVLYSGKETKLLSRTISVENDARNYFVEIISDVDVEKNIEFDLKVYERREYVLKC